jgi:heme-degrading monooxygenase HmoA
MYLRITRGKFDVSRYDEGVAVIKEVGDAMARLPGFQGYQGGQDRATGAFGVVSTWDTEEHARFSRDSLGEVMTRQLASGAKLEPAEIYEVVVQR